MIKCNIWFTYVFYIKKSPFQFFLQQCEIQSTSHIDLKPLLATILSCDFKGNRQEKVDLSFPNQNWALVLKIFYTARMKYTRKIGVGFTLKQFSLRNC